VSAPCQTPPVGPAPMSVGQILDRIFCLLRRHFRLFLKISGVMAAGMFATYLLFFGLLFAFGVFHGFGHQQPDPARVFAVMIPAGLLAWLLFMLVFALFDTAATYAALQADHGITLGFREAYAVAFRSPGRFLWLMILRVVRVGLPMIACYPGIAALVLLALPRHAPPSPGQIVFVFPLIALGYLGSLVYAVIMGLRLALAVPACIEEGVAGSSALRRSITLTRNAKGRIFLVMLVVYAAGYGGLMVIQFAGFVVGAVGALLLSLFHLPVVGGFIALGVLILCVLGGMFAGMGLLACGFAAGLAVIYHDQRRWMEGVTAQPAEEEPA
jgi:hypothetical protein